MKIGLVGRSGIVAFLAVGFVSTPLELLAQFTPAPTASALSIPEAHWLKPEALLHLQQIKGEEKPLILQVGSHMLFAQAHIPGSEYIGPGSQPAGIQQLQNRVSALAQETHCALLWVLSAESLSEPRAGIRKTERDGFYEREGSLSRRQLRHRLGRQRLPG
jgi:hypothetical protein